MPNGQDKAWTWHCNDFSEGTASLDKLAAKFRNPDDAKAFKAIFEAAVVYNRDAKAGKDLVVAEEVEDIEEAVVDDIDTNKTADPDAQDGDDK